MTIFFMENLLSEHFDMHLRRDKVSWSKAEDIVPGVCNVEQPVYLKKKMAENEDSMYKL